MTLLSSYPFMGNIRELRNIVERISVTAQDTAVQVLDVEESLGLGEYDRQIQTAGQVRRIQDQAAAPAYIRNIQKEEIERLLKECGYNKSEVARRLGLNRTTLWRKMGKMGLL